MQKACDVETLISQIETFYDFKNTTFQPIIEQLKQADFQDERLRIKTVKQILRKIENYAKMNCSDFQAYMKKLHDFKLPKIPLLDKISIKQEVCPQVFGTFDKEVDHALMTDYNMNHLGYSNRDLCLMAVQIFEYLDNGLNTFQSRDQLHKLVEQICLHYNVIPYHNFTHGFALFQLLFSCYEKSQLKAFITRFDALGALLAGLSHDLNHKGVNNLYKVKRAQMLGKNIYESAVLECMHSASFFSIIASNPCLDFFQHLPNKQAQEMRRLIVSSILATDMSQHFTLFNMLKERVEATNAAKSELAKDDKLTAFRKLDAGSFADKQFVLMNLVHASDISNPCLRYDLYINWSVILAQEFNEQTLKEAGNGQPVTAMFQYKGEAGFYAGQVFFLNTFVIPLWSCLQELFEELKCVVDEAKENLRRVESEKTRAE